MTRPPTPPRPARLLLWLRPLGARRADVVADLHELFNRRIAAEGLRQARRRFYVDVLSLWWSAWPSAGLDARTRRLTLTSIAHDAIYALRLFRRHPALVAVTVFGLAIAIALATTAYTYFETALFRPFGVADPDRLLKVAREHDGIRQPLRSWTWADADRFLGGAAPHHSALVAVAVADSLPLALTPGDEPREDRGDVWFVGPRFFELMGGRAAVGRLLGTADDAPADVAPVVLSHAFWQRDLGGDVGILGRRIELNDRHVVVIGVAAAGFTGPSARDTIPIWARPVLAWAPMWAAREIAPGAAQTAAIFARLAPDSSAAVAAAELTSFAAGTLTASIGTGTPLPITRLWLQPAGRPTLHERDVQPFWIMVSALAGLVVLVLLLACANATNLLLASAATRQREIGVRLALGASRGRLVRQLLTESVLLTALSAAAGLLLAAWAVEVMAVTSGLDPAIDVSLDTSVYLFVAGLVFAVGLLAGLAPARYGTGGDLTTPIKGDAGGATPGRAQSGRLRRWLVGGQAATSCLLLVIAALLVRAAATVSSVDTGLPIDRLLIAQPNFTRAYDTPERAAGYWRAAAARVAALPGVERAAVTEAAPFMWNSRTVEISRDGRPYRIEYYPAAAEFIDVLGLRVLRGRPLTRADIALRPRVAVISETLARAFWPAGDPVGGHLGRLGVPAAHLSRAGLPDDAEVVGVVSDAVLGRLTAVTTANVYLPLGLPQNASLLIRTRGDAADSAGVVQDALRGLDRSLRPSTYTVASRLEFATASSRDAALAASALGALALSFAVIGVFGVTAFAVSQRRREIGVRMALGATSGDVTRQVLRESLRPVMVGALIGAAGAASLAQMIAGRLQGVSSLDPWAYAAAVAVLLTAAAGAAAAPTRRAARLDPAPVLRQ